MPPHVRLSGDPPNHNDKDPAIAVDGDGRLWAAWQSYHRGADRVLARSIEGGLPGPLIEASEAPGINLTPTLTRDGADGLWCIWSGLRDGRWRILARQISPGARSTVAELSASQELAQAPSACTDGDVIVFVAWCGVHHGRHGILGRALIKGRCAKPAVLSDSAWESYRPTLCANASGCWLAYESFQEGGYQVFLRHWDANGHGQPIKISRSRHWEMFPRLCSDGRAGVWIAWTIKQDVMDPNGIVDHRVDVYAADFDGDTCALWRGPDHTKPDGYVAHLYYERSFREAIDGQMSPNHRIVLYPGDDGPLYRHTEPNADTEVKFVQLMEPTDAFVYPHHPHWQVVPSSRLGGVEVTSSWGIYVNRTNTIPEALRAGYRLAFIGSSDTHRIVPGLGGALTGVWARELTREAITEALWARRCFATNGEPAILDVRINGAPMGSAGVPVSGPVRIECRITAPRSVRWLTMSRDEYALKRVALGAADGQVAFEDIPGPGEHFCYLCVQMDSAPHYHAPRCGGNLQGARGCYAWSSPIWVDAA